MIVINDISVSDNGKRVEYNYSMDFKLSKYFNKKSLFFVEYELDVSSVPKSILAIPLLVNILPISWFLDFEIKIEELDEKFTHCIDGLKQGFQKMYPQYELKGSLSVSKLIENKSPGTEEKAMLFSGGVDAISAYIRHAKDKLSLISIRGADIALEDDERWNDLLEYNRSQKYLSENSKYNISSNLRTFYTYKLEKELNLKWWGQVQHGMALLGVTAPLTYLLHIRDLYIGSTHTKQTQISWGSNPITDELLCWANTRITHECYDLTRQEKLKSILDYARETEQDIGLRVCYSERREDLNCGRCEKCLRTILGIILEGSNPNVFGFKVDKQFYSLVDNLLNTGINTIGIYNHWKNLQSKAKNAKHFFVFENKQQEEKKIKEFCSFQLKKLDLKQGMSKWERWKFSIINKYPALFNFYMKFRLKLIK